jgi:DUF4097 and DUF4098 domain-containing protein YvlB
MTRKTKLAIAASTIAIASLVGGLIAVNTMLDSENTTTTSIAQPVTKVIVAADSGDVRVVATDADRLTIRQTRHWVKSEPKPEQRLSDGVLRLDEGCDDGWPLLRCETDYRIELPRGFTGSVAVESDSGDIEGSSLAPGQVKANSDSGNVHLTFASAPASLDAWSDSGDVDVELPRDEYALDADTDSGDESVTGIVRYDAADHTVSVRSDSGDVTVLGR